MLYIRTFIFKRYINNFRINSPIKHVDPRWFYATDIPNTKPFDPAYKLDKRPLKFLPFSIADSKRLEIAYSSYQNDDKFKDINVNVNEDGLFSVNIVSKILKPTYWIGPTYEVRRGIWFKNDNEPIPDLLSDEIEEYYKKYRPDYLLTKKHESDDHKLPGIKLKSEKELYQQNIKKGLIKTPWPYTEYDDLSEASKTLYFKDEDYAILLNKDQLLPRILVENFSSYSNSIFGLYYIKRGYKKEENITNEEQNKLSKSSSDSTGIIKDDVKPSELKDGTEQETATILSPSALFNETNKKFQNFMENDFANESTTTGNNMDREVDHLILCVHGIGQTLSSKYASINFAHDCNHLRQLLKSEFVKKSYKFSPLAYGTETKGKKNCKIQILPIIWRHNIDFGLDYIYNELGNDGVNRLPTLSNLNVDSVTPLRNLTADVLLDILLFYEPKFHEKILSSVVKSANEIYDNYLENHPNFKGKISLIGHSLGSSIVLDILSNQPDKVPIGKEFDDSKHLKFKVENFFSLGSPNGVFKFIKRKNIRPRTGDDRLGSAIYPNVGNYYNIFYATDLVAYRVEPLIHSLLSTIKPKNFNKIPEENLLTSTIKDLSESTNNKLLSTDSNSLTNKVVKKIIENTTTWQGSMTTELFTGQEVKFNATDEIKGYMYGLNKNGRVDYVLPQSMFDIDILSAVGSHVQYFDDPDVADFILRELWKPQKTIGDIMGVPIKAAEEAQEKP